MFMRRSMLSLPLGLILIFALALIGGCSTKTSDRHLVFLDASEAMDAVRGQRRMLGGSTTGVWVDPRTEREFREGHIAGAIHMPLERVREDHRQLRQYDVIVVYGNDFNSPRAAAVSKTLMELGHRDVRTLRGGLKAWKDAGHPEETGR